MWIFENPYKIGVDEHNPNKLKSDTIAQLKFNS